MDWCHLENSFWVINQASSRGRKANGVLGVFHTKDRKKSPSGPWCKWRCKWGRIGAELQSRDSCPSHKLRLTLKSLSSALGEPRRGWPVPKAGQEMLRNSLITDTDSPLSFSRTERNTVGGSTLGTAERQGSVCRGSANFKHGIQLEQALRKKDPTEVGLTKETLLLLFFWFFKF